MISIANTSAASFLRRDLLKHLAEVMQLERGIPACPTQAFADADPPTVIMLVSDMPWGVTAFLSHHQDDFTTRSLHYLTGRHDTFSLSTVNEDLFRAESVTQVLGTSAVRCVPSLACTHGGIGQAPDCRCRQLGPDDRAFLVRYPQEPAPVGGRPPSHAELFDMFVVNGKGESFGFVDDDGLAGYLTCDWQIDNVWDVVTVHVLEGRRNQDIGTQLALAYARRRLGQGEVAYYSSPTNPASERAAEKAGFTRCRLLFST